MSKGWVKVFSSEQAYMVEIMKGILEEEKIDAISLNKTDSMHTHLSIGEVELFVQSDQVMKAKLLISKAAF
jgi:hypothetical protein